jgi:hypothetical protein
MFSLSARLGVVVNPRNRSISSLPLSVDEMSSQYCKMLLVEAVRIVCWQALVVNEPRADLERKTVIECAWLEPSLRRTFVSDVSEMP